MVRKWELFLRRRSAQGLVRMKRKGSFWQNNGHRRMMKDDDAGEDLRRKAVYGLL